MQFTDRKTHFTDCIPLLSIRSIRTDRHTVYNHSCHENILSPTNEMRFTDRKPHFTDRIPCCRSVLSIRIDTWLIRTVMVRVYYNPHLNEVLKTMFAGSTFPSLPSPHSSQSPFLGACWNRHYELTNRCFGLMLYSKIPLMYTEWVIEVSALSELNLQKMSKDCLP